MTKFIAFAGSIRKQSVNQKLAKAATNIAKQLNAEVEFIDLADYQLPIYNEDLENQDGIPENALKLAAKIKQADAIFIASPEYNGSFSSLLKNCIDWISRVKENNQNPFNDKFLALGACSPGPRGGLSGLTPLRMLMCYMGSIVMPTQVAIGSAFGAFDENDNLVQEKDEILLNKAIKSLLTIAN